MAMMPKHVAYTLLAGMRAAMVTIVIGLVRCYQFILSPLVPPRCRFIPTCSEYCIEAVTRYGVCRGLWKAFRRVLRCHPFHPGGIDLP